MLRKASTVIVVRKLRTGRFNILYVKRHQKARFLPSAHVFPGGVQEQIDGSAKWRKRIFPLETEDSPQFHSSLEADQISKVTAIRELFEEANILLASRYNGDIIEPSELSDWRTKIQKDDSLFFEMIETLDLFLRVDMLRYWAHWITPKHLKYRYDTSFFLTVIDEKRAQMALQDNSETVRLEWLSPSDALREFQQKNIRLELPTWVNTLRLSKRPFVRDLLGYLQQGIEMSSVAILPHPVLHEDGPLLILPGDPEYPEEENQSKQNPIKTHRAKISPDGSIEYLVGDQVFLSSKL